MAQRRSQTRGTCKRAKAARFLCCHRLPLKSAVQLHRLSAQSSPRTIYFSEDYSKVSVSNPVLVESFRYRETNFKFCSQPFVCSSEREAGWGAEGFPCTGGQAVTFSSFLSLITSSWPVSFRECTQRLYHLRYLLPLTCRGCGCCGLPEDVGRRRSSCLRAHFTVKITVREQFHTTALDLVRIWMGDTKRAKMQAQRWDLHRSTPVSESAVLRGQRAENTVLLPWEGGQTHQGPSVSLGKWRL